LHSLVPRPFLYPVFDCLQDANTERNAREIWSCVVTRSPRRQRVDTQGAVPDEESQKTLLAMSVQGLEARAFARQYQYRSSFMMLGTGIIIMTGHHPLCVTVYLMPPYVTKSPSPPHSIFAYCKRSKTGGGNSLGTRLVFAYSLLFDCLTVSLCPRHQPQYSWLPAHYHINMSATTRRVCSPVMTQILY